MKKFLLAILLFICANIAQADGIKHVIFFGDSLSDNGNLYHFTLHCLPFSPPYYDGRFSNGKTWAEQVGEYYTEREQATYKIYAVGGATVVNYKPHQINVEPPALVREVTHYFLDHPFQERASSLFVFCIGGNDYLHASIVGNVTDYDQYTDHVMSELTKQIERLVRHGAKHFLIVNLPDLGDSPYARQKSQIEMLHTLTLMHNQKLAKTVAGLEKKYSQVSFKFFDAYAFFEQLVEHTDQFNLAYHTHLHNVVDGCWNGGYTRRAALSPDGVTQLLNRNLPSDASDKIDMTVLSGAVMDSPDLTAALELDEEATIYHGMPCTDADSYLFWDKLHPTAVVHRVLAQAVLQRLGGN